MTVLFCRQEVLLPTEGLSENPERYRNGNEEQTEANWATPAEPRTPRAPVFHVVLVPVVFLLVVLETSALVLHSVPLLLDESPSLHGFDDVPRRRGLTHSYTVVLVSVHVVRRMSSAWLQWDDHVTYI